MNCPKCGSFDWVKNGKYNQNTQRFKCKKCGYQAKDTIGWCYTAFEIKMAKCLYENGLSFRTMACLYLCSPNTVSRWIKKFDTLKRLKNTNVSEISDEELVRFVREKLTKVYLPTYRKNEINVFLRKIEKRMQQKIPSKN